MDQVEEVKQKTDIVSLIGERVELKRAGRNFRALCPFHSERTPSFMVSPELGIFKCFGCFPAGELVKTPFGLHEIQDVVEGEYVVSGKGRVKRVLARHERNYEGYLVSVRLSKLTEPVTLTADHKVLAIGGSPTYSKRYKYLSKRLHFYQKHSMGVRLTKIWHYFPIKEVAAEKLRRGMTLLYPVDTNVQDVEVIDLRPFITKKWPPHGRKPQVPSLLVPVKEDLLKLLGYYIAEGSNHRAYIRFSLGDHERAFAKEIILIIRKIFGLHASFHRRSKSGKTGIEVTCCNSLLANIFGNFCGKYAENKHIPFIFQHLPHHKQRILLEAVFKGDGHESIQNKSVHITRRINTISKVLAEQLRDILLRLGYFPSHFVENARLDRLGVHHKRVHLLHWMVDSKLSKFRHIYEDKEGNKFWLLPISSVKRRLFRGKVYNLTVAGDHSYIANTFAVANCGKAGDAYAFLEEFEGMEFPEALSYLAKRAGVKLEPFRKDREFTRKRRLLEINHLASEFYQYLLTTHTTGKRGLRYLASRGVRKGATETFKLGFAADNWDALIRYLVGKKGYELGELEQIGLVVRGSKRTYDRFRNRVMFPLRDVRGNVVGFAGRIMPEAEEGEPPFAKATEGRAKYINSPETELYHKSENLYGLYENRRAIKEKDQVAVVEGELDVISSWQVGVKNVVGIKGTALTNEQIGLLRRYTRNVILSLDADSAGDAATKRGISLADSALMNIKVSLLSGGKDPDEISQANPKRWRSIVAGAISVYDFYLKSTQKRFDASTGLGKKQITEELIPVLSKITNVVEQAHYVKKLAQILDVEPEVVMDEISRWERMESLAEERPLKTAAVSEPQAREKSRREVLEEYFLALLMQGGKLGFSVLDDFSVEIISHPGIRRIIRRFLKASREEFKSSAFIASLPAEIREMAQAGFLQDLSQVTSHPETTTTELEQVARELVEIDLKDRLSNLGERISELEAKRGLSKTQEEDLARLQREFSRLVRQLSH